MFTTGQIRGVLVKNLAKHVDDRGWLAELFREDEVEQAHFPVMGYVSMTQQGVVRGPHEHSDQADFFVFIGPSNFKIYLWDNRRDSPTFRVRQVIYAGVDVPRSLIIPAGVVHAYKNVGSEAGMVINLPNRLFSGRGRKEAVDEIRHENDPNSPFVLD